MRFGLMILAIVAQMASASAGASVIYTFKTVEPFAGGTLSFTYDAPDFLKGNGLIQRSDLTNVMGDIQRVRFDANCSMGGSSGACDQLTVFAGTASAFRYFGNGSFARYGNGVTVFGAPATLTVAPAVVADVPESATWAMMILGMGAIGYAMRRRIKMSEINFTKKVRAIAAA